VSTRAALALTQASWRTAKSYRLSFVLSFVSLAVTIVPVYFVANALQQFMAPVISNEGRDYFGFVLIGTAILTLVSAALSSFQSAVSGGLSSGFFEALLVTPTPLGLLLAGQTGYSFAWAAARALLLVGAGVLLGVDLHWLRLPEASIILVAVVAAMLSLKGEDATAAWLKAEKNNSVAYRGNTAALKGVNNGEVDGAIIYHYYYFGDKAKTGENSDHVALHFFKGQDPGAFVSVSGGGVLKSSKHKEQALAFLKWIAGKGGQDVLKTGTSFEYAVGNGADSNAALPPLAMLEAPTVDPSSLDSKKVTELMTAAGLI